MEPKSISHITVIIHKPLLKKLLKHLRDISVNYLYSTFGRSVVLSDNKGLAALFKSSDVINEAVEVLHFYTQVPLEAKIMKSIVKVCRLDIPGRGSIFSKHIQTFQHEEHNMLCSIDLEELDSIISAGVDSIKIEGRMKTENYVSLVTWVYRMALDSIKNGNFDSDKKYYLKSALDGSSHRNFTKGFMFQKDKKELEDNENVGYVKKYEFTGTVKGEDRLYGEPLILVRNQFSIGQTLDILQPGKYPVKREIGDILLKPDYRPAATANPNDVVIIRGLKNISPFSILRIKK